ncbi:hypothetical protein TNCV_2224581 [Trichonephila clavipes]|nr:hypothetical protein TNCV_2224581 [Trichonephila clavipes]
MNSGSSPQISGAEDRNSNNDYEKKHLFRPKCKDPFAVMSGAKDTGHMMIGNKQCGRRNHARPYFALMETLQLGENPKKPKFYLALLAMCKEAIPSKCICGHGSLVDEVSDRGWLGTSSSTVPVKTQPVKDRDAH